MGEFVLPGLGIELGSCLGYILSFIALWGIAGRLYPFLGFLRACFQHPTLKDRYGPGSWAVVTGASYGIGLGFCHSLAQCGFNIALIARSQTKMQEIALELETKFQVQTKVIPCDFSKYGNDYGNLYSDLCTQMEDLDVSVLVNNVGTGQDGFYERQSDDLLIQTLSLNVWPVIFLSHWALDRMRRRKLKSAIINLSSVTSCYPYGGFAIYSATKKFDDFFTISMANETEIDPELKGKIDILSLRPSYVQTPLMDQLQKKADSAVIVTVENCVEGALKSLGNSKYTAGHLKHKLLSVFLDLLPESLKNGVYLAKLRSVVDK